MRNIGSLNIMFLGDAVPRAGKGEKELVFRERWVRNLEESKTSSQLTISQESKPVETKRKVFHALIKGPFDYVVIIINDKSDQARLLAPLLTQSVQRQKLVIWQKGEAKQFIQKFFDITDENGKLKIGSKSVAVICDASLDHYQQTLIQERLSPGLLYSPSVSPGRTLGVFSVTESGVASQATTNRSVSLASGNLSPMGPGPQSPSLTSLASPSTSAATSVSSGSFASTPSFASKEKPDPKQKIKKKAASDSPQFLALPPTPGHLRIKVKPVHAEPALTAEDLVADSDEQGVKVHPAPQDPLPPRSLSPYPGGMAGKIVRIHQSDVTAETQLRTQPHASPASGRDVTPHHGQVKIHPDPETVGAGRVPTYPNRYAAIGAPGQPSQTGSQSSIPSHKSSPTKRDVQTGPGHTPRPMSEATGRRASVSAGVGKHTVPDTPPDAESPETNICGC